MEFSIACKSFLPSKPMMVASCARAASVLGRLKFSTLLPYRLNHSGSATAVSHSGAMTARPFSAARSVSPTRSSRFIVRTAARTCVESVRCLPRCLSNPSSCTRSRSASSKINSSFPSTRRVRNSLNTVWSKPESTNSRPSAYFQSIRPRTASAVCRSENASVNWSTVASASRQGDSAGCPRRGNRDANCLSRYTPPSASAMRRQAHPFGNAANATRRVSSGTPKSS